MTCLYQNVLARFLSSYSTYQAVDHQKVAVDHQKVAVIQVIKATSLRACMCTPVMASVISKSSFWIHDGSIIASVGSKSISETGSRAALHIYVHGERTSLDANAHSGDTMEVARVLVRRTSKTRRNSNAYVCMRACQVGLVWTMHACTIAMRPWVRTYAVRC
jgi:hypothetical protein